MRLIVFPIQLISFDAIYELCAYAFMISIHLHAYPELPLIEKTNFSLLLLVLIVLLLSDVPIISAIPRASRQKHESQSSHQTGQHRHSSLLAG